MAKSTFSGPVRSQDGFQAITTSSVGTDTTNSTYGTNASVGGTLTVTGVGSFPAGLSNPTGVMAATVSKSQVANAASTALVHCVVHCTHIEHTVHCPLDTAHCILHTAHCTLHT